MWKKLAGAMVVAGALSLGSVGVAVAAPATSPGTGAGAGIPGTAGKHLTCANAPMALGRIDKAEARVTQRLPKLQAAEQKAKSAGHTKLARRIEKRIDRLTRLQSRGNDLVAKIEAKCPGVVPANPSGGTGSTGSTGSTSSTTA